MKLKTVVVFILIGLLFPLSSQASLVDNKTPKKAAPQKAAGKNYRLVFSDEFKSKSLNKNKWTAFYKERTWADRNDGYRAFYNPGSVSVAKQRSGNLDLGIRPIVCPAFAGPSEQQNAQCLGSGMVDSSNSFNYRFGYAEFRAHLPFPEGDLGALWLFPINTTEPGGVFDGTARDGAEVDVVEAGSKYEKYDNTLHFDGYGKQHQISTKSILAPGLHKKFYHRYGFEWTPRSMRFYFDGRLVRVIKDPKLICQTNLALVMSHELFGSGDIAKQKLNQKNSMLVDYVRVWQQKP